MGNREDKRPFCLPARLPFSLATGLVEEQSGNDNPACGRGNLLRKRGYRVGLLDSHAFHPPASVRGGISAAE